MGEREMRPYLAQVSGWQVVEGRAIQKNFKFRDFTQALAFVNKVGDIAEAEGHHPDINLHDWNQVEFTLSTHALGGLSENDFILAFNIDALS